MEMDPYEKAVAVCEAWFRGYSKVQYKDRETKELVDRIRLTFDVNPFDMIDVLVKMNLGEHVKVYVTKPDLGA